MKTADVSDFVLDCYEMDCVGAEDIGPDHLTNLWWKAIEEAGGLGVHGLFGIEGGLIGGGW